MKPTVSVIVPVYNCEKYIDKCINSILNQTFKDFELILINDGSLDKSPEICNFYKQKDKRVRVIHKKNEGVSSARNIGIDIANGEYITFVDSDDYLNDTFLETSISIMKNHKVDLYMSGLVMESYNNGKISRVDKYAGKSNIYNVRSLLENLHIDYPLICICGPWCKLFKKEILEKYNIKFNTNMSLGEDTDFNLNYLEHCKKIYFCENSDYHYVRNNEESLFTRYNEDSYDIHVLVYDKMRTLYYEYKCSKDSCERFEDMYVDLLIGCIHNEFRNSDKNTPKKRKDLINRVANNKFIKEYKCNKIKNNLKKHILVSLLKNKIIFIVNLLFNIWYLGKKEYE